MAETKYKKHLERRRIAKGILGKYKSLEVTWKRFDCGLATDGTTQMACEECVMCEYNNFMDFASSVGKPPGTTIERNEFLERYEKLVYGV